jgi:hypothetical protein
MNETTVLTIVKDYLEANGYDGLRNSDGECGCELSDLSPLDCLEKSCSPGYKVTCVPGDCPAEGGCDWHIGARK